ncbi:MAG: Anti-sigma-K factor rskA [Verrucomicrobiota bacterium]|jgi:anti-sigma-K factor RskA
MKREHIEELAALDALGALDGDDVAAWQNESENNPEASRLRDEFSDIAARLSLLASEVPAPAALRARVMDAVFGADKAGANETAYDAGHDAASGRGAWAAAAAVALLALAGAAGTTARKESVIVRDARPDAGAPFVALDGYGDYASAKASIVWDSGQRGWWMQAAGLPALPPTHRYRVWAIGQNDGEVYDCGELQSSNGCGRIFLSPDPAVDSMRGFAVSIEPAGAKPKSPGTPAVLITPALRS